MNIELWKFAFQVAQALATVGVGIYVWWSNREKVTTDRFIALEKTADKKLEKSDLDTAKEARDKVCAAHKAEIKALEQAYKELQREVNHLPDHNEITELSRTIKELTEKIGNLDGRMSGVNRAVDLMNEFLINQGGK